MAQSDAQTNEPLIVGAYGRSGAYGPTILLELKSPAAARWLHDLFLQVRRGQRAVDLTSDARVRISGITRLQIDTRAGVGPLVQLRQTGNDASGPSFLWTATSAGWSYQAGLLEPFMGGRPGHQYLTSEESDDAIVEVSLYEAHTGLETTESPRQ